MTDVTKWLRTLCANCIMAPQNRNSERLIPCCLECSNKHVAAAEIDRLRGIIETHIQNIHADGDSEIRRSDYASLLGEIEAAFDRYRDIAAQAEKTRATALSAIRFRCLSCGVKTDIRHVSRCETCGKNQWEVVS